MTKACVELILQQFGIVGANVNAQRKTIFRMNSCRDSVKIELAKGNSHPVSSKVAEPKDPLAVCHDNHFHRRPRPVAQDAGNIPFVIDTQVHALGVFHDVTKLFAGLAHCWRVDDGHTLSDVGTDDMIKEGLVVMLEVGEQCVSIELCAACPQLLQHPCCLQFERGHGWRQKPSHAQARSFFLTHSGAAQQGHIAGPGVLRILFVSRAWSTPSTATHDAHGER